MVWRTIKDKHYDPTLGGLDWNKVREQYAPRVEAVKSDSELYSLLQQMISELKQSHFNIIPPEAVIENGESKPSDGGIGIDLRIIDNAAVITRVEPGSAAERAGLRPGFAIKQIDQTTVASITERVARIKESQATLRFIATRVLMNRINGTVGSSVRIGYLDARDAMRTATLTREPMGGEMSQAFGNFGPQRTEFEARRLDGGIGYIRFNIFVPMLTERIRKAVREMKDAPGIIFDLRGNPGGLGAMAYGIAGVLETSQTWLGTMQMRSGYVRFAVFPQPNPFTGKVVILIDGASASTSEIFAAGMQENRRAIVVGERSMGAALPSVFEKLPTGALFQYAIGDFKTPKGVLVEGRGVIPDVEVKLSRAELLRGRDPQLDAAVGQITKATTQPAKTSSSLR
jgi:carboxyl-terminal processing protease